MTDKDKIEASMEQKPAEWSEEDNKIIRLLIAILEVNHPNDIFKANEFNGDVHTEELIYWLKSLRPPQDRCEECPHRGDLFLLTQGIKSGKHDLAVKFMSYLDENRPEGKMSLSNGECEDIDKAFKENDWATILRYAEKYSASWKPSEEQMEWLETAFRLSADKPEIHRIIESLLIDLKKLM